MKLSITEKTAYVYVYKRVKLQNCYLYKCYTILDDYSIPLSLDRIDDPIAVTELQKLEITELPAVTRINAYNYHCLPGNFGIATCIRAREQFPDQDCPSFAVAHFHNACNQFKVAQKFTDASIYIKKLDRVRLYYIGAYYDSKNHTYRVARLYIPLQQTSEKLRHHMNIIYQLQHTLSEAEYKDLRDTLKLHFEGDDITVTFYHHFAGEVVTARFDFYNTRTDTCMNFSQLADDPVGLLLSLYHSTKAYVEGREPEIEVRTSGRSLR